jgi:hypothetical protein
MTDPFFQLWFAVRYIHVVSVALLAGGALIVAASCFVALADRDADPLRAAAAYEWVFWMLVGAAVVTGVSNLGLKGDGLPGPATSWGRALTTKLVAVLALLGLSLLRSDYVIRCVAAPRTALPARALAVAGSLYAATVAIVLGAMWIGLGLGHGRY